MEAFQFEIDDRLVQVLLKDDRGPGGATLVLSARTGLPRILPVQPHVSPRRTRSKPRPPKEPKEAEPFPTFPQGFGDVDQLGDVSVLHLDTSELPADTLEFSLDRFAQRAALAALAPSATVRLTLGEARDWGLREDV